jgi:hypothetical protein
MVALWLLALQTPSLPPNLPTDVDFLRDVVCLKDKAYLMRAPVHVASSVSFAFLQPDGSLLFERNEPMVSLRNPNPRKSGIYRWDASSEKTVALMEFSERSLYVGGAVDGRLFGYTVRATLDAGGNAVGTVGLVRYSLKDRKGDNLELPAPGLDAFIEGNPANPYISVTTANKSFLTRLDGGGWLAEGEQFVPANDGRVFRRTMSREGDFKTELFNPANGSFTITNDQPGFDGIWVMTRSWYAKRDDGTGGKVDPTTVNWSISKESQSSGRSPAKFTRQEGWLVSLDPEGPNRAPICWDASQMFRVQEKGIAYVEKGHLFYRPIFTMDRKQFEEIASAMEANVLMQNAKQVVTGLLIYAADNDDNMPPTAGWQDLLMPYLRNAGPMEGFEFNPPDGVTNFTKIQDPGNTPVGRLRGRFGTAVAMGDGSVRWVKNP